MKVRKGFISNSSSTSFICDVCAETVGGWDMGLEEADMFECENGHTFCREHTVGGRESLEEKFDDDGEAEEFDSYEVPAKYCPCCTFEKVVDYDLVNYFLKEAGKTREDMAKIFKDKFTDYDGLKKYLKAD